MKRSTRKDFQKKGQSGLIPQKSGEPKLASVRDVTGRDRAESYLEGLNNTFLELTSDFDWNIKLITESCGELLGATFALYATLREGLLHILGRWHIPEDYNSVHRPDGRICYDVIRRGTDAGIYIVNNLQRTSYVKTDPLVVRYQMNTFVGYPVICFRKSVGSLCLFYQEQAEFDDNDEKILGILAKAIGIEEQRKQVEEALRESEERYRGKAEEQPHDAQMAAALGPFPGGIVHDLKNLLTVIEGDASLMLLDMDPSHPHYGRLRSIEHQVELATGLIRQLLRFTRGAPYEFKPTDLNDLIQESSEIFARAKKGLKIHGKYQKDLSTADVNQGQIERVFLNLYMNAWHAMPGGGDLFLETKNVTLDDAFCKAHDVEPGRYVKVSVTDTGVGMDEAIQQRIFEPFFTTDEIEKGKGLGLATVYATIKNHRGVVEVSSKKGEGTAFSIYLPASEKEFKEEKKLPEESLEGKETLLLVDDEEMIVDVGAKVLKKLGYKILKARNGKEAIEVYKANKDKIDVVIMDTLMPDTGYGGTYSVLKGINPAIRVILINGYSGRGQASAILESGCDGFIQKPFRMKELSQKIREVLDKK